MNKQPQKEDWRIVKTIDFSELGGKGYEKGEKVRILPNAKKERWRKSGLSWNLFIYSLLNKKYDSKQKEK